MYKINVPLEINGFHKMWNECIWLTSINIILLYKDCYSEQIDSGNFSS